MENKKVSNIRTKKLSPLAQGSKRELTLSSTLKKEEREKERLKMERRNLKERNINNGISNRKGIRNEFKKFYDSGDLPVRIEYGTKNTLKWLVENPMQTIDFHYYLPLFVEGLHNKNHPYNFIAREGLKEMLVFGGDRILAVIPQLILPLKSVLESNHKEIIIEGMTAIQIMIKSNENVGELLLPYYRQLLHAFRKYKDQDTSLGDEIEYGQTRKLNLSNMCNETLALLESSGGPDAGAYIKDVIPTYESISYK